MSEAEQSEAAGAAQTDDRPWPADVPKDPLEEERPATMNADGEVLTYPATQEKIPESIRKRRYNRAKAPRGWLAKARRMDGKSAEYWKTIAEMVMDETGIAPGSNPFPPTLFQQQAAARYAMLKSYTTLERMEMAIQKCEEKLADKNLSEDLQIEWMNAYHGVITMQNEAIAELNKSAVAGDKKNAILAKPKNLPPLVIQQNFSNGRSTEPAKVVDEAKAIGETGG